MHRESVYVCTYTVGEDERVAHVRAWNRREAAELFAREIELDSELDSEGRELRLAEIRVRPAFPGDGAVGGIAG